MTRIECSECPQGFMIPSKTGYKKRHNNITLEIEGVPVLKCASCKEINYSISGLLKAIKEAVANYEETGEGKYWYNNSLKSNGE